MIIFVLIVLLLLCFIIILQMDKKKEYYFDNNATTTYIEPCIKKEIIKWIDCGNPSNTLYKLGQIAALNNYNARKIIANDLMVDPSEIYFTANATEANNIAIQSIINYYLSLNDTDKYCIMCSNAEHPSVLEIFKHYESNPRIKVTYIPIDNEKDSDFYASINPSVLKKYIENEELQIIIISIMFSNNETGAINPIKTIGNICNSHNIIFHCDATQAIGKYIIHPEELGIHALSFSGHKIHAPKGVGALYLKNQIYLNNNTVKKCDINTKNLKGVCFGGEQTIIRPGTENVAFNIALAMALLIIHTDRSQKNKKMSVLKKYIVTHLNELGHTVINPKHCTPNTILVIINNINCCNKVFARDLANKFNVCVGTSSACQTSKSFSHVTTALNIPPEQQNKIIRISLSDYTTLYDCEVLIDGINKTQNMHKIN